MSEIPKEFSAALKKNGLDKFFSSCTAPHQREYLDWIGSSKKPETKMARIEKAIQMISAKKADETKKARKKTRSKP